MAQRYLSLKTVLLLAALATFSTLMLRAQVKSADPQASSNLTAEQTDQLTRLNQLEEQLQKSRTALHATINEYGWESDQADAARAKLFTDRAEYRKLRRSLRASGVAVPPPSGYGMGASADQPGQAGCRHCGHRQGFHRGGDCRCSCGGW